jgi:hypothetical protein
MTMRTCTNFECAKGRKGTKETSENDQPYSRIWESVSLSGIREVKNSQGEKAFECVQCGLPMEVIG